MGSSSPAHSALPDPKSPDLHLSHPTPEENVTIWSNTSASWRDSLTPSIYLKESLYLTTVPLAKDGGMTTWILVDKNLPPNDRPILCSCESFIKRSLTSDSAGKVSDAIVHGIASVFCPPAYRGRGYAARLMNELAQVLRTWKAEQGKVIGSILYSDIGKTYYAKLGWKPNPTNFHVEFKPSKIPDWSPAKPLAVEDLAALCKEDEFLIRKALAAPAPGIERRMTIIPNLEHMLWHISKEDFVCELLFGKPPHAKGAIVGEPGNRIWIIWTHRYYGPLDAESPDNTLYILRLVFENENRVNDSITQHAELVSQLKALVQAAQDEAAVWKLDHVKLWDPSPATRELIVESGIEHVLVEREEASIASGLWYDTDGNQEPAPLWLNNEHYSWC